MFVACGIWCLADVSSVSPSSEQTHGMAEVMEKSWNFISLVQRFRAV